jgi:hypothetical protein
MVQSNVDEAEAVEAALVEKLLDEAAVEAVVVHEVELQCASLESQRPIVL